MIKKIELDVAFEEATELITLTQKATKYGIELKIVSETADYNGGWPVVEFTGEEDVLLLFLDEQGFDREMLVEEFAN